jgi:hypothetical protein
MFASRGVGVPIDDTEAVGAGSGPVRVRLVGRDSSDNFDDGNRNRLALLAGQHDLLPSRPALGPAARQEITALAAASFASANSFSVSASIFSAGASAAHSGAVFFHSPNASRNSVSNTRRQSMIGGFTL